MTPAAIAAVLSEMGTLLELQGENPFRTRAYHTAARTLEQFAGTLTEADLEGMPGIGDTMHDKIVTLLTTGQLPSFEKLKASFPAGVLDLLRVPGLGPKKVKTLADAGFDDLDKLKQACVDGHVAEIKGFGGKTQAKILEGIEFLSATSGRVRIDQAERAAGPILERLRSLPGVQRVESCGSLRRRRETIGDLDFLVTASDAKAVMAAFVAFPEALQVLAQGDTLSSIVVSAGSKGQRRIRADLRVIPDDRFAFALHHFTGSKEHHIQLRSRASERGYKLNEYGMSDVKASSEADIYAALGLPFIPPELREGRGEIAAAEAGTLPDLIEVADIRGVFHNHTTASDGGGTLEEMVAGAQALGLKYLGIADHSQSLGVAHGLTPERLRQQMRAVDELNDQLDGFRVFKGTESDILADGSLDFDDSLLAELDYVVASVHTVFGMSREDMTARIIRAVRHPRCTMLGHATGRLLLKRDAYAVDLDAVLKACADSGTMIEINAQPMRLELDWIHCQRAKELGVTVVINPDAHSPESLGLYRYGVDVARRGWLTAKDVFNTKTAKQVAAVLARR